MTCHQATGQGAPNAFSPEAGSAIVNGLGDKLIVSILHGVQSPPTVTGVTCSSAMMPYGTNVPIADEYVAAVANYECTSWGNSGSVVPVADVARWFSNAARRSSANLLIVDHGRHARGAAPRHRSSNNPGNTN
ncbi:hypothetical protein [Gemmatimonas sp.]|uniref:hypothetical protein n=1 Tax=Gemmatimonas sp. TaxID=1962908 RepID=UPI00286B29B0|nr:hypothetical protein [Gemmatimonas sp.]